MFSVSNLSLGGDAKFLSALVCCPRENRMRKPLGLPTGRGFPPGSTMAKG